VANIEDVITSVVILFAVAFAIVLVINAGHRVNTALYNVPTFNNSAEVRAVISSSDTALDKMDYVYMGLFIGLFLGLMIGAYFVGGIPILAPIYFFILILFSFIGIVLQKVWISSMEHASFVGTIANLPITNYIISHLGYFTVVIGLVSMVLMYVREEE
jgi:hypothetical protein